MFFAWYQWCWLFHLVGDVHQPLHTVSLFKTKYPDGDRGGNLVFVRAKRSGAILDLHQLWDGLLLAPAASPMRATWPRNCACALISRERS